MSDILYRRNERPGSIPAVPPGDITINQFAALRPDLRREVKHSPLFDLVGKEPEPAPIPPPITLDPLGELNNDVFNALSPADKGQRTKEANRRAEEAAKQTGETGQEGDA